MEKGTTVHLTHPSSQDWNEKLRKIHQILTDYGLVMRSNAESYYIKESTSADYKYVASLDDMDIDGLELCQVSYNRSVPHDWSCISLAVKPKKIIEGEELHTLWTIDSGVELDTTFVEYEFGYPDSKITYQDVLDHYNLIKKIFVLAEFEVAWGSKLGNFFNFDEVDAHSIFRFDRNGPCRVVVPYEERRTIEGSEMKLRPDYARPRGNVIDMSTIDCVDPIPIKYYLSEEDNNLDD